MKPMRFTSHHSVVAVDRRATGPVMDAPPGRFAMTGRTPRRAVAGYPNLF